MISKEDILLPKLRKLNKASTINSSALKYPLSSRPSNSFKINQILQIDLADPKLIKLNDPANREKIRIIIDGTNSLPLLKSNNSLNSTSNSTKNLSIFIAGKKLIGDQSNQNKQQNKNRVKESLRSTLGSFTNYPVKKSRNLLYSDKETLTQIPDPNLCLSIEEAQLEVTLDAWDY